MKKLIILFSTFCFLSMSHGQIDLKETTKKNSTSNRNVTADKPYEINNYALLLVADNVVWFVAFCFFVGSSIFVKIFRNVYDSRIAPEKHDGTG